MLVDPPIEKLLPKASCAYELAVLVSKRASQLVDGAQPLVPDDAANVVSLACKEIADGKVVGINRVLKKSEYSVPLTKEARDAIAAEKRAKEEQENYKRQAQEADVVNVEEPEIRGQEISPADDFVVVESAAPEEE